MAVFQVKVQPVENECKTNIIIPSHIKYPGKLHNQSHARSRQDSRLHAGKTNSFLCAIKAFSYAVNQPTLYTRFRSARVPRPDASVVAAGAVVFRTEAALVALFFTANEAVWVRGTAGFLVVVAVPVVALRAPVPVRVGFVTVVPDDAVEPLLFRRSPWRVAGRGKGDLTALGPVAARAVVFLGCVGCRPSLTVDVVAPRGRVPAPAARSGLDGLSGEVGRDKYEGWPFSGEARKGECGYVRELRDLGERMRWSLLRTSWETTREAPPAALGLLRRLGFFSPSGSPVVGAFSLSENPSWL